MKTTLGLLAAAAALSFAGSASAQGYIGIAGGAAKTDINCTGTAACDDTDTGFKLFGGVTVNDYLAIELHYADFGKASARLAFPAVTGEYTGQSIGLSAVFSAQLADSLTASARIGVASNRAELTVSGPGFVTVTRSDSNAKPYFGVGLGYRLTQQLSLNAGADFTQFEIDGDKGDSRLISVGLSYAF